MLYSVSITWFACCIQSHTHQSTTILQAILLQASYAHTTKVSILQKRYLKILLVYNLKNELGIQKVLKQEV